MAQARAAVARMLARSRPARCAMSPARRRTTPPGTWLTPGVPERVAMTVTGHKTRSVFDRCHIVSPGDLQEVARRLTGTMSGTVTPQRAPRPLDARAVSL